MRPIERGTAQAPSIAFACDTTPPAEIADAQAALNVLAGARRLSENGELDQPTRRAISEFQRSQGMEQSGCLDERTQTALLEAAAEHPNECAAEGAQQAGPISAVCDSEVRPHARVTIQFRTYAPFHDFGGGFHGDDRGPSNDPRASSRLRTRVDVDTRRGTSNVQHGSSGSIGPAGRRANERPHGTAEMHAIRPGVSQMTFSQIGSNPLLPSPDIDRRATVVLDETVVGHLKLHISAEGDNFPNCEMSVADISGRQIYLDGYATPTGEHGPFTLFGDDDVPLLARDIDILVDDRGRFMGVVLPSGEPISVEAWNARALASERRFGGAATPTGSN